MSNELKINISGAVFEVVSDRELNQEILDDVKHSLSAYPANVLHTLSKGDINESPVRIIIAPQDKWFDLTRSLLYRTAAKFNTPPFWSDTAAMYSNHSNELFIKIEDFPPAPEKQFNPSVVNLDRAIKHEFAHAVDDFGVFKLSGFPLTEGGSASTKYFERFHFDAPRKTGFIETVLVFAYGNKFPQPASEERIHAERMAASIAFLIDPNADILISKFREGFKIYPDEEPPENFRDEDLFLKTVKTYLANFPEPPPKL